MLLLQYPRRCSIFLLQCRVFGPAQTAHGLWQSPPLRTRRPRRDIDPAYPYGTKEQDLLSWATSHTSSANDPMCHVRGFTSSSPCLSVHMLVASVFPRALLPVRGMKPREYDSDTPVTTRPEITAKIYSTR